MASDDSSYLIWCINLGLRRPDGAQLLEVPHDYPLLRNRGAAEEEAHSLHADEVARCENNTLVVTTVFEVVGGSHVRGVSRSWQSVKADDGSVSEVGCEAPPQYRGRLAVAGA